MKNKKLFSLMLVGLGVLSFTACSDDDDAPEIKTVTASDGAFVVNAGNTRSAIDGSLTYFDYNTSSASQSVFKNANGRSLGVTANDGVVYGSKVYLVVDGENTVEVFDKKTFRSIKQIKTTALLGTAEGTSPRHIIAAEGQVFFTTYGGYVAAIDTTNYALSKKWQVGSYPEGLTYYAGNILVANSDYSRGNGTLSSFATNSDQVQTITIHGVENPQKVFVTASGQIAVLDWGHYLSVSPWTQENTGLKFINPTTRDTTKTVPATMADYDGRTGNFYIINSPYGSGTTTYSVFNAFTGSLSPLALSETPASPNAIKVDAVRQRLFVLSYSLGESGYASYSTNGYCLVYDFNGTRVGKFDTGVGPTDVFFDTYTTVQQ